MGVKKEQEKEFAKLLFLQGESQKEIAGRINVSEQTISRWVRENKWEDLKKSLLTTRTHQITQLYNQLAWINADIANRKIKVALPKEADAISKITSSIQRLEVETSIAEYVEVGRKFINFLRPINLKLAKETVEYFDAFISQHLNRH